MFMLQSRKDVFVFPTNHDNCMMSRVHTMSTMRFSIIFVYRRWRDNSHKAK